MELLAALDDGSVDLVVSSPPYNIGKSYESKLTLSDYLARQSEVLRECVRVMDDGASIFWQVGAHSDDGTLIPLDVRFFPILEDLGLRPRNRIIWVRQHGLHGRRKFSARHETVLWFTKGDDYTFNLDPIRVPQKYRNKRAWTGDRKGELTCHPDGKNPGDIWVFRNVKHNHEEQTVHPCQFPEDMIARIVLSTTNEGAVVLDPYMGTGTVAVVARDLSRTFLGAELNANYHRIAEQRISGLPDEHGVFPNLKTLRAYVERTGEPIETFRFAMQVGQKATSSGAAKIKAEPEHFEEMLNRLSHEEDSFAADIRGMTRPSDYFKGGQV
jgi:adenine-specific DNA-methyltransferase